MQQFAVFSGAAALAVCLIILSRAIFVRGKSGPMNINVKWGSDRFHIDIPAGDVKLGELRQVLAEKTSLEPNAFKIVHSGAVMKDDNAPVSAYGLRNRSTIAVVGKKDKPSSAPAEKPTEASTISRIQSELTSVRTTLVPPVESFLESLQAESVQRAPLAPEHKRLDELLLQSLLRLDAMAPDAAWEDARRERKLAVREVQGQLDRLDKAWKALPK